MKKCFSILVAQKCYCAQWKCGLECSNDSIVFLDHVCYHCDLGCSGELTDVQNVK